MLDTPPILEVVEITPPTEKQSNKPIKKVIKKIPLIEATEEEAEKISEAIKTPIKKNKPKAPIKNIVEHEEDEEIAQPPPPVTTQETETKTKLAKKNKLVNECEKLLSSYNDCTDELFKIKQTLLRKQEELKTDFKYNLKLL
jgi:hypothetical protein